MKRIRSLRDAEKQLEILREQIKKTEGSGKKQKRKTKPDEEITEGLVEKNKGKKDKKTKGKNTTEQTTELEEQRRRRGAIEELIKISEQCKQFGEPQSKRVNTSPLGPLPKPPTSLNSGAIPEKIKPKDDNHSSTLQTQPTDEPTTQPTDKPTTQNQTPVVRVKQQNESTSQKPSPEQPKDEIGKEDTEIIQDTSHLTVGDVIHREIKEKEFEEIIERIEEEMMNIEDADVRKTDIPQEDFQRLIEIHNDIYKRCLYLLQLELKKYIEKYKKEGKLDPNMKEEIKNNLQHALGVYTKLQDIIQQATTEAQENYNSISNLVKELLKRIEK